ISQPVLNLDDVLAELGEVGEADKKSAEAGEKPANKDGVKDPKNAADINGPIVAVSADGKRFTLELPSKVKGEEAKKIEIKLGDKTAVTYFGVPQGGAKPTEGYPAAVWLEPGSIDSAARVTFGQKKSGKEVDISGRVATVSADGKRITIEVGSK